MDLMEVLGQVRELLQKKGRITYRMLQAQFHLDNEALEALREELIEAEQIAVDEDDKVLVWVGNSSPESRVQSLESKQVQGPKSGKSISSSQSPAPGGGTPPTHRNVLRSGGIDRTL